MSAAPLMVSAAATTSPAPSTYALAHYGRASHSNSPHKERRLLLSAQRPPSITPCGGHDTAATTQTHSTRWRDRDLLTHTLARRTTAPSVLPALVLCHRRSAAMPIVTALTLLTLVFALTHRVKAQSIVSTPNRWSYNNPSQWGQLEPDFSACGDGRSQSPIDLSSAMLPARPLLPPSLPLPL